jgi:hypothetical protein
MFESSDFDLLVTCLANPEIKDVSVVYYDVGTLESP